MLYSFLRKTRLLQALRKGGHLDIRKKTRKTQSRQNTDHPSRFLRARRRRPRCRPPPRRVMNSRRLMGFPDAETTLYHIVEKSGLCYHTKLGTLDVAVQGQSRVRRETGKE